MAEERRKAVRLKEENDVVMTIISGGENLPKERIYSISTDISPYGTRIQTTSILPVDTNLDITVTLKEPPQMIKAFAKVKWIKRHPVVEVYEAGLEFFDTSSEITRQLTDYISWKQQSKKT